MEAAPGISLENIWNQTTGVQHIQCIQSMGKIAQELCSLDSANFGSLYFDTPGKPAGSISPRRDWGIVSSPQQKA
jgi:hypothetical protein